MRGWNIVSPSDAIGVPPAKAYSLAGSSTKNIAPVEGKSKGEGSSVQ